jgi:hypothetical protein
VIKKSAKIAEDQRSSMTEAKCLRKMAKIDKRSPEAGQNRARKSEIFLYYI